MWFYNYFKKFIARFLIFVLFVNFFSIQNIYATTIINDVYPNVSPLIYNRTVKNNSAHIPVLYFFMTGSSVDSEVLSGVTVIVSQSGGNLVNNSDIAEIALWSTTGAEVFDITSAIFIGSSSVLLDTPIIITGGSLFNDGFPLIEEGSGFFITLRTSDTWTGDGVFDSKQIVVYMDSNFIYTTSWPSGTGAGISSGNSVLLISDSIAPSGYLYTDDNNVFYTNTSTLIFTGLSAIYTDTYSVMSGNDIIYNSFTSSDITKGIHINLNDGIYVIYLSGSDIAGNLYNTGYDVATNTKTLVLDSVNPTIEVSKLNTSDYVKEGDVVTLLFTGIDSLSGINTGSISIKFKSNNVYTTNSSAQIVYLSNNSWTASYIVDINDQNGYVGYEIILQDKSGNYGTGSNNIQLLSDLKTLSGSTNILVNTSQLNGYIYTGNFIYYNNNYYTTSTSMIITGLTIDKVENYHVLSGNIIVSDLYNYYGSSFSGIYLNIFNDGTYNIYLSGSDLFNHTYTSSTLNFILDTKYPDVSLQNVFFSGADNSVNVYFSGFDANLLLNTGIIISVYSGNLLLDSYITGSNVTSGTYSNFYKFNIPLNTYTESGLVVISMSDVLNHVSTNTSSYILINTYPVSGNIFVDPLISKNGVFYTSSTSSTLLFTNTSAYINSFIATGDIVSKDFAINTWNNFLIGNSNSGFYFTTNNGIKNIYVQFKNNVGVVSQTQTKQIILDTIKPQINIISNKFTLSGGSIYNIEFSGYDINTDTGSVSIYYSTGLNFNYIGSGNITSYNNGYFTGNFTWNVPYENSNDVSIMAQIYDFALNTGVSILTGNTIDSIAPSILNWSVYSSTGYYFSGGFITQTGGLFYFSSTGNAVGQLITISGSAIDNFGISGLQCSNGFGHIPSKDTNIPYNQIYTVNANDLNQNITCIFDDIAGNITSAQFTFINDNNPPIVLTYTGYDSITQSQQFTNTSTISINFTAVDLVSGVVKYIVSDDSSFVPTVISNWLTSINNFSFTNVSEGVKTLYFWVNDGLNNILNNGSQSIIYDKTSPTSNTILINSGALYTNTSAIILTLSSTDILSGLSQMQFSCDNTNWTTPENFDTSKSFDITNESGANCTTSEGTKIVYVKYKDNANNWSMSTGNTIVYDISIPINGSINYFDGPINNASIYINVVTGNDLISGLSTNDSDYKIEVLSGYFVNNECILSGSWIDVSNYIIPNIAYNINNYIFSGSNYQCYQFRYFTKDNASNIAVFTGNSITKIDTVLPNIFANVITNTPVPNTYSSSLTIYFSGMDVNFVNGTGMFIYLYSGNNIVDMYMTGGSVNLINGQYTFDTSHLNIVNGYVQISVYDSALNQSIWTSSNIVIDNIVPQVPVISTIANKSLPAFANVAQPPAVITNVLSGYIVELYNADTNTLVDSGIASSTSITLYCTNATIDGTYNYKVRSIKQIGFVSNWSYIQTYDYDGSSPYIINVTSNNLNGHYKSGQTIIIDVQFNETVFVAGMSYLILNNGSTGTYLSGHNSNTLKYKYDIKNGDDINHLDYLNTSALILNINATIKDLAGNNAILQLPNIGSGGSFGVNKNIVIDTIYPVVDDVIITPNIQTYSSYLIVNFSGSDINLYTGSVFIGLYSGNMLMQSIQTGAYTNIYSNHYMFDTSSINTNSGYVFVGYSDIAGNTTSKVSNIFEIDNIIPQAPIIQSIEGNTNSPVILNKNNPLITISNVQSGYTILLFSGNNVLSSKVATGNIVYFTLNLLNSGTYILQAQSVSKVGYLSNKSTPFTYVYDNVNPYIINVTTTLPNGSYGVGVIVPINIQMSKNVYVSGNPYILLNNNGTGYYFSGNGTNQLTFLYTVEKNQSVQYLDYLNTSALILNGGSIKDIATNDLNTILPVPGNIGSLSANKHITIKTIPPQIISIISDANTDGWLKIGDSINFTLSGNEIVSGGIVIGQYNNVSLNWVSNNFGQTFTSIYVVSEGHMDRYSPLQITGVILCDALNNCSDPSFGNDILKKIDANRPTLLGVNKILPTSNYATSGSIISISLSGSELLSGATIYTKFKSGNFYTTNSSATILNTNLNSNIWTASYIVSKDDTNGYISYEIMFADVVGNYSSLYTGTLNVYVDNISPMITVNDKIIPYGSTPILTGYVIDDTPTSLTVSINNNTYNASINGNVWTSTASVLNEGTYVVYVSGTDIVGNTSIVTGSLTVLPFDVPYLLGTQSIVSGNIINLNFDRAVFANVNNFTGLVIGGFSKNIVNVFGSGTSSIYIEFFPLANKWDTGSIIVLSTLTSTGGTNFLGPQTVYLSDKQKPNAPLLNITNKINMFNSSSVLIDAIGEPNTYLQYSVYQNLYYTGGNVLLSNTGYFYDILNLSSFDDGIIYYTGALIDSVGNVSEIYYISAMKSTMPPTVDINNVYVNKSNYTGVLMTGNCSSVNNSVNIFVSDGIHTVSGSTLCTPLFNWYLYSDFSTINDGIYIINVSHKDSFENIGTNTGVFTKDLVPPQINIYGPSMQYSSGNIITYNVEYSGAVSITLTGSDISIINTGNASGNIIISNITSTSAIIIVNNISGNGSIYLYIKSGTALDNVGNIAPSISSNYFIVDTIPPIINNISTYEITNDTANISFDITELNSLNTGFVLFGTTTNFDVNNYSGKLVFNKSSIIERFTGSITGLENGTKYYYIIYTQDIAGNVNINNVFDINNYFITAKYISSNQINNSTITGSLMIDGNIINSGSNIIVDYSSGNGIIQILSDINESNLTGSIAFDVDNTHVYTNNGWNYVFEPPYLYTGSNVSSGVLSVEYSKLFSGGIAIPILTFAVGANDGSVLYTIGGSGFYVSVFVGSIYNGQNLGIYYSHDDLNWFRHGSCTVSNSMCNFWTNHMTIWAIAIEQSYSWDVGSWGSCQCGTNTQSRNVVCKRNDGVVVADNFCISPKPSTSMSCIPNNCTTSVSGGSGGGGGYYFGPDFMISKKANAVVSDKDKISTDKKIIDDKKQQDIDYIKVYDTKKAFVQIVNNKTINNQETNIDNEFFVYTKKDMSVTAYGPVPKLTIAKTSISEIPNLLPRGNLFKDYVYQIGYIGDNFSENINIVVNVPDDLKKKDFDIIIYDPNRLISALYPAPSSHWSIISSNEKMKNGKINLYTQFGTYIAYVEKNTKNYQVTKLNNQVISMFNDIVNHWASEYIADMIQKNIVEGYIDGTFRPDNNITRAEALKVVMKVFNINTTNYIANKYKFKDVSPNDWFVIYLASAVDNGIVDDTDLFRPNDPITRAEALKIIIKSGGAKYNPKELLTLTNDKNYFVDVYPDNWYSEYVYRARDLGIVNGYKVETNNIIPTGYASFAEFRPNANITRAELIKIGWQMMQR